MRGFAERSGRPGGSWTGGRQAAQDRRRLDSKRAAPARAWPVRRKNSIPRRGQRHLRDARSNSANDDALPAVVGARQVAGDRHASTAEYSRRLGDAGRRWCPENDFAAIGDTDEHPVPGAQAAMLYSW
jgi:hypothetical protein